MLKVLDVNGDSQEVEVMRYFQLNNGNYLLYSLNEADEQDDLKLYGTKIQDGSGVAINDEEWNAVKEEIKKIIKGNQEGNLTVDDLDYKKIDGVTVNEYRAFKLSKSLVSLLKANQKVFVEEEKTEETSQPEPAPQPSAEAQPEAKQPEQDFNLGIDEQAKAEEAPGFGDSSAAPQAETKEEVATPDQSTEFPEVKPEEVQQAEQPQEPEKPAEAEQPAEEEKPAEPEMPTKEEVSQIQPETVGEDKTNESVEKYEHMFEEMKKDNDVLRKDIEDLKAKLDKLAKVLSE